MSRSDFGQYVGWWRRLDVLSQAASATEIDTRRQNQSNKIRFKDAEFDFVTVAVYFTMGHQRRGLRWPREVVRVLGPGGVFPVLERNPYNPVTRLIVSRTPVDVDAILLRQREARKPFQAAGLAVSRSQYFPFLREFAYWRTGETVESWLRGLPLGDQYPVFGRMASGFMIVL